MAELNLTPAPLNKNNIWGYLELLRDILVDISPELSLRISKLLSEKTFQFSPVELQNIHKKLFIDIFRTSRNGNRVALSKFKSAVQYPFSNTQKLK